MEKLSNKYLEKLVNTKDKTEYKNLLKSYTRQKEITQKVKDSIARIEYANEHSDYETGYSELQKYQSNFDEVMKKTRKVNPVKKLPPIDIYNFTSNYDKYLKNYISEHVDYTAFLNQIAIDTGTNILDISNQMNDSHEL